MRIAINCRIVNKRHGGPRRFLLNIIKTLASIDKKNEYFLVLDKKTEFSFKLPRNFHLRILSTSSRILFEYIYFPRYIIRTNPDITLFPDPAFAPYIPGYKITIIHDIIYFEKDHKREFKFLENYHHKLMIPICTRLADVNLCVSRFTQDRVKKLLNCKNTNVIYEGVENSFQRIQDENKINETLKRYQIKKPFIFYIGSLSPRKNIKRLLNGYMKIKSKVPHRLYLIVGYSWCDHTIENIISNDKSTKIKKVGFVAEKDLPAIYSAATALVYPSLYEGFGLPILEAQACGCPVLTSNRGATKEISRESALLINPLSSSEIAEGI